MTQFELWYAYYDSLFQESTPNLPQNFCLTHTLIKSEWPSTPCPALSDCFSLLEAFLKCSDNWIASRCTVEELNTISDNLNTLLHFLSLQKQYASCFWSEDPRRVQASITHLYCFLQNLVRAIIPYSSMTIFQCKAAYKLCVELSKLQELFKKIFKKINCLAEFLSQQKFQEERHLIVNFFQNFVSFMKQLPKIKRNQLNHVHNLTQFVSITTRIKICHKPQASTKRNRKKSCTIGTAYQLEHITADQVLLHPDKMHDSYRRLNDYIYRIPQKSHSCDNFNYKESKKQNSNKSFIKIFSFPERINKQAEATLVNKKNKLESFRTLTTKMDSISKNKSNTMTSITSPLSMKRMKTTTTTVLTHDSPIPLKKKMTNREREKSNIKFYDEEEERFQLNSVSSFRPSVNIKQGGLHKIYGAIELDKDKQTSKILLQNLERNIHVYSAEGKVEAKGWDFVRGWFWERVKMRRLRRVITSEQFY